MTNKKPTKERDKLKVKQWREANKEKMRAYQKIYQKNYKAKLNLNKVKAPKKVKNDVVENVNEVFNIMDFNDDTFVKKSKVEIYCLKKDEQKIGKTVWVNLKTDNLNKTLLTFAQSKRLKTYGIINNNE